MDQPSSTMPSATHRDELTSSCRRANLRISRAPSVEAASLARPRHKLSLLWPLQSVVGLVGVALNSIVFYMFVSERQNMANSVNVLIWYSMVHLAHTPTIML